MSQVRWLSAVGLYMIGVALVEASLTLAAWLGAGKPLIENRFHVEDCRASDQKIGIGLDR